MIGTLTCAAPPCANPVAAEGATTILVAPLAGTNPASPSIVNETITLDGFYTGVVSAVAGERKVIPIVAGGSAGGGCAVPGPANDGWERLSTLSEPRLSEMAENYRALGYEVDVRDVQQANGDGCNTCFDAGREIGLRVVELQGVLVRRAEEAGEVQGEQREDPRGLAQRVHPQQEGQERRSLAANVLGHGGWGRSPSRRDGRGHPGSFADGGHSPS